MKNIFLLFFVLVGFSAMGGTPINVDNTAGNPANVVNVVHPVNFPNGIASTTPIGTSTGIPYLTAGVPAPATQAQAQTLTAGGPWGSGVAAAHTSSINSPGGLIQASITGDIANPALIAFPQSSKINVACLGDSFTAGIEADYPGASFPDPRFSYPGQLATMGFSALSGIYNFGTGSQTTTQLVSSYVNSGITSAVTTTLGSTTATVTGSTSGITSGMGIAGVNYAPNTTITISGSTLTLSQGAIGAATSASALFASPANTNGITTNVTTTLGSTSASVTGSTTGLSGTMFVLGPNFAPNSTATISGSTLTLGNPATATATSSPAIFFTGTNTGYYTFPTQTTFSAYVGTPQMLSPRITGKPGAAIIFMGLGVQYPSVVQTTGTLASGSNVITSVGTTSGMTTGTSALLYSPTAGIPTGAYITATTSNTVTMSVNATANGSVTFCEGLNQATMQSDFTTEIANLQTDLWTQIVFVTPQQNITNGTSTDLGRQFIKSWMIANYGSNQVSNIHVLNLDVLIPQMLYTSPTDASYWGSDGSHQNSLGLALVAGAINDALGQIFATSLSNGDVTYPFSRFSFPDVWLSTNIPRINGNNVWSGYNTLSNSTVIGGSGSTPYQALTLTGTSSFGTKLDIKNAHDWQITSEGSSGTNGDLTFYDNNASSLGNTFTVNNANQTVSTNSAAKIGWTAGQSNVALDTYFNRVSAGVIGANGPIQIASGGTIRSGSATPNSAVTGNVGDIYLCTSGGSATTLWVKESGAATNTGWVGK